MTLKNAVNELMDFAKAHGNDVHIAYRKMRYAVNVGDVDNITLKELEAAKEFIDAHYNAVVEARKTGDWSELSEVLGE